MKDEMENQVHKHPEWKRLFEEIAPLVAAGKTMFSYAELDEMAGVPIASSRGRRQFMRFQKEALGQWSVWFENVRGEGYRVVKALAIVTNTKLDELTESARKHTLESQAILGAILHVTKENNRALQKLAAAIKTPALGPTQQELDLLIQNVKKVQ